MVFNDLGAFSFFALLSSALGIGTLGCTVGVDGLLVSGAGVVVTGTAEGRDCGIPATTVTVPEDGTL